MIAETGGKQQVIWVVNWRVVLLSPVEFETVTKNGWEVCRLLVAIQ